jgi:signal transduction histidine kinase
MRELTESRARIVATWDRERRRLERDLHDGVQQQLMGIRIKLRLTADRVEDKELAARLVAIGEDVDTAVEELRTVARRIYPPALATFGLADALRSYARRSGVALVVEDEGIGRCPSAVEAAIYFCATEAVRSAGSATIVLGRDDRGLRFEIAGVAVGADDRVTVMRDRIGAVGGELEITASTVRGSVPL